MMGAAITWRPVPKDFGGISKPSSGLSVTYRRTGRVLVALDSMRNDPKGEELIFLVRAWNAVFAKAQSLGWLN
jgi:hypothetical protein